MNIQVIDSENPQKVQWQLLSQYTYLSNIARYRKDNNLPEVDEDTAYFISGCVRQAQAYFESGANAPLDIAPLLLYYGTSNLLAGAWALIKGNRPPIREHGMKLVSFSKEVFNISDVMIQPLNPSSGALQVFCDVFSSATSIVNGATWSVKEILGSIPDVRINYLLCHGGEQVFSIPLETIRKSDMIFDRIKLSDVDTIEDIDKRLLSLPGFLDAYLKPQVTKKYIILFRKIQSEEIGMFSINGEKYFSLPHPKNGALMSPDQIILYFMGLYTLGNLSRYYPEHWHPFVHADRTGERLLIERFLYVAERYIPNLVLNILHNSIIQFSLGNSPLLKSQFTLTKEDVEDILEEILRARN